MSMSGLKQTARRSVRAAAEALGQTKVGRVAFEQVIDSSMGRTTRITHAGVELTFAAPNELNHFRTTSFATKEPETLAWIDSLPRGSLLWDVGANIGLYSCYAAKARGCRVVAFEPSVFNLELLARNIFANGLTDRITIMPLPLFERVAESTLNMSSMQWGGALSTFGASIGFDGAELRKIFEFRTVGLSMDDCLSKLCLEQPDYMKMDVDGIEHMILRGGRTMLTKLQGVAIEINDAFMEQAQESRRVLEASGLSFVSKAHSEMIEANPEFNRTFNQVWARR